MTGVRALVFPSALLGSFLVLILTNLIALPIPASRAAVSATTNPTSVLTKAAPAKPTSTAASLKPTQKPTDKLQPTATKTSPVGLSAAPAASKPEGASQGCSLGSGFPENVRRWCTLIEKYASQHSVNPNLVAAVMWLESGGNPQAYSKSGAVGLMQVMPRDGLAASFMCSGKPCFASRPSMAELYDPEYNISYGVRMLAGLYQRNGSWREALKSYGPIGMGYEYADRVLGLYEKYKGK